MERACGGGGSLQSTEMAFQLVSEGQGNPAVHGEPLIPSQTDPMFSAVLSSMKP